MHVPGGACGDEEWGMTRRGAGTRQGIGSRLRQQGIRPKKRLAQHFITQRSVLERIASEAQIQCSDTVVEIGAGLGDLTELLAQRAKMVVALELDESLVEILKRRFQGNPKVKILLQDAMEWPLPGSLSGLGRPLKVIGNLPYNVATQILLRFCQFPKHLDLIAVMLQREVAQRVVAPPGSPSYGALSPFIQLCWDARIGMRLGPSAFHPPPKVVSALVVLRPLERPRVEVGNWETFRKVVRVCFDQRRKMLRNALKALDGMESVDIKGILAAAGLDGAVRGERLSLEEFARLSRSIDQWRERRTRSREEDESPGEEWLA
jgi:16S rRNA (adenine1518-N6/adenine1519-N6)-dimethyltransferase